MFKMLNDLQLTPNFRLSEFECHDGSHEVMIHNKLPGMLQALRVAINRGITIAAAYRNPKHNKEVGGSPNSRHMLGEAADIKVTGMHPLDVALMAEKIGFTGIGVYTHNGQYFVHLDVRPVRSYWCDLPGTKNLRAVKSLKEIPR